MRRLVSAIAAAFVSVVLTGAPAAAALPSADLALKRINTHAALKAINNPDTGKFMGDTGIGWVSVDLEQFNYGPGQTPAGAVVRDITAPAGTAFRTLDENFYKAHPLLCKILVPHTHVRCKVDGSLWVNTGGNFFTMYFVLKKQCTKPGRYSLDYAGDPNKSNNTVTFLACLVPGVSAAECSPPKPSTRPASPTAMSPSASPAAAQPSPAATASFVEPPSAYAAQTQAIADQAAHDSGSGAGGIVIGAIGAVAGLALLSGLWLYGRRRRPAHD